MAAFSYNKAIYWLLRICVLAFGLLLAMLSGVSLFRNASFFFSEGGIPPLRLQSIPSDAVLLFYALLLLAPHRWFLRQALFIGKMLAYCIFVLWFFYRCFKDVSDFATGKTIFNNDDYYTAVTEFDLIFTFILFVLALLAPLTLFLKRRLYKMQERQ